MEFVTVYTTTDTLSAARSIAQGLLADRLAACVNIGTPEAAAATLESHYHWQGQVESAREIPVYAKTRRDLFPRVAETIRRLHPYETPCIVAWPIVEIDAAYAKWLETETTE